MSRVYHLLDEREAFSENSGGAISRWAANALRDGTEVVVCPAADSSWGFPAERVFVLARWCRVAIVHPFIYRAPWQIQIRVYLALFKPLFERVQRGDIIYVHNRTACAAVLATVAQKYGFKVVLHMHNSMMLRANRGQLRALQQTTIVYCSGFLMREVEAALPGHFRNVHVVYNGADEGKFYPDFQQRSEIPKVIFTGRLVPYKGVHVLLQAMGLLANRGVQAKCEVVGGAGFGTGRVTGYIKKLKRHLPANTELLGYRSGKEFAEILRRADIFCCPSIWNDPFPLAPLEGMAAGLPIVASEVGGLPEELQYGGGLLVPPNDPEGLANALESLIVDRAKCQAMGAEARFVLEKHFLWSSVRKQYLEVVRELQEDRAKPNWREGGILELAGSSDAVAAPKYQGHI